MKVLIGIITRNRAELLPQAIQSALDQDYPEKEVVVLDIASTDGTPAVRAQFPQVRWIRSEERLGIPESRNLLMSETDAAYFFSLDDDAWFLRHDEVALGVKFLEAHADYSVVAYDILLPGDQAKPERGQPRDTAIFIGCGHLLRLADVRQVGFYAPNPTVYGGSEESDLSLRLYAGKKRVIFLPGVHVWHERTNVGRDVLEQYKHNLCNDLVALLRRCPLPDLLWMLPYRLLSHFRFALRRRWLRSYFVALGLFARSLPSVLPSRDAVDAASFRGFLKLRRSC